MNATQVGYPESQWGDFYERVRDAIAAVPGVSAVAFSDQSRLMAYHVARGSREIGLRLALGARPTEVALRVVREAALLVGAGAVLGVLATLGTARVIQSYLYGVPLHDPLCLTAAVAVLALVAVVATWLPARHAARIDPMVALRRE